METVALRTPHLDAYSGQSFTTPSTSTAYRTLAFKLCAILAALLPLTAMDTANSSGIQGADVDPDGYAEAAGNLKAQGKT
uniref:Uncharacterized protein n=1 Tax=Oryza nivara TaxID=4536 RepID=A0A0E0IBW7_ORYNI